MLQAEEASPQVEMSRTVCRCAGRTPCGTMSHAMVQRIILCAKNKVEFFFLMNLSHEHINQ